MPHIYYKYAAFMYYIVYKTTNLINGKEYIGIHQTDNVEDGYLGSGLAMKRAIKKHGRENFKREVLDFCSSYDELLSKEKLLVNETWVNNKNNYNLKTGGQSVGMLSEKSKDKISNTLKHKYRTGELLRRKTAPYIITDEQKNKISDTLKERYKHTEHNRKNKEPWNKGCVDVQIPWNTGLATGPISEEQKQRISKTLKDRYQEQEHHRKGKPSWNKGKTGFPPSWNKDVKLAQTECPHCYKMVDAGNGKRWHFDMCKLKP